MRRFTYVPLPALEREPLEREWIGWPGLAVAGATADDLLLRTPLLEEMTGGAHATALRAFRRRRAYANLRGDFMVPFGTAAIEAAGWSVIAPAC